MRGIRWVAAAVCVLAACSPAATVAAPPPNFPDVSAFRAVDVADYDRGGTTFLSPDQGIDCLLDRGPYESVLCHGFQGVPTSVSGTGCSSIGKPDVNRGDVPYVISRTGGGCVTARSAKSVSVGRKIVGRNATCVVGRDDLIACIDADNRHGFVLRPSGSWVF